eukprot:scaffold42496_cov183-Amphora_coffeaeformis.AAC.1
MTDLCSLGVRSNAFWWIEETGFEALRIRQSIIAHHREKKTGRLRAAVMLQWARAAATEKKSTRIILTRKKTPISHHCLLDTRRAAQHDPRTTITEGIALLRINSIEILIHTVYYHHGGPISRLVSLRC